MTTDGQTDYFNLPLCTYIVHGVKCHSTSTKLELSRAHILRAHATSYLRLECQYTLNNGCSMQFVGDLYLPILTGFVHTAWTVIGVIDRRGQQKRTIWSAVSLVMQLEANTSKFFTVFWLFGCAYRLLRCQDVEIWRFLCQQMTAWLLYPLHMHAG